MKHIETQSTKREIKTSEKALNLKLQCPLFIIGLNSRCWLCLSLFVTISTDLYLHKADTKADTILARFARLFQASKARFHSVRQAAMAAPKLYRLGAGAGRALCPVIWTRIGFRIVQIVQCAQPPNTPKISNISKPQYPQSFLACADHGIVASVDGLYRWSNHGIQQQWSKPQRPRNGPGRSPRCNKRYNMLQLPGTSCH